VSSFRLGEYSKSGNSGSRVLSLRRGLSLKTGARHLRDSSREPQGALLTLSLWGALLAWAKNTRFLHCPRVQ